MKILVVGGTGTVGSQVVRQLLARNVNPQVLTRSIDRSKNLPQGAQGIIGDLLEPSTVRSVFNGIDALFLLNAVSTTETHEGLMAVNGARMAGVKRLVYLSVPNLEQAPHLPHFGSKLSIETVIKASGISYTILRPNNFFQNDHWFKDAMLQHNIYPQPIGDIGLSRIDVCDIAEAAAIALTTTGHEGQTYTLGGPHVHTGQSTAEIWSQALGKRIAYGGNDLDVWEQQSLEYLPAWMVFDFRLMYEFFQKQGLKAALADLERQRELLSREPRSFEDFAKETASMWKAND